MDPSNVNVNACHKRFNLFFGKQDFSKIETQLLLNFHVFVKVVKSQYAFSVWSQSTKKCTKSQSTIFFYIISKVISRNFFGRWDQIENHFWDLASCKMKLSYISWENAGGLISKNTRSERILLHFSFVFGL